MQEGVRQSHCGLCSLYLPLLLLLFKLTPPGEPLFALLGSLRVSMQLGLVPSDLSDLPPSVCALGHLSLASSNFSCGPS